MTPGGAVAFWRKGREGAAARGVEGGAARSRRPTCRSTICSRPSRPRHCWSRPRPGWGRGASPPSPADSTASWGDWYARKGDKAAARAAYARALTALDSRKSAVEQDAWRGALSRSTEEFLRDKEYDRARDELRKWQEEFPVDKVEGYLTLLQARYCAARSRWPLAIALAGDLVAINPDSPYADRLVYLAAAVRGETGAR